MTYFYYGMRLRGFSLGCQPLDGLIGTASENDPIVKNAQRKYYDYLVYNRELTEKELKDYELDYLGTWHFDFGK